MSASHDASAHAAMRAMMSPDQELNQTDRNIYAYLVYRANGARLCWKTVAEIQADLNIGTRQTVCAATAKLRAKGLIEIRRRLRVSNHYIILDPGGLLYGNATSWQPPWERDAPDVKESAHLELDVKDSAHLAPDVKDSAHLEPPPRCQENRTSDVKDSAHLDANHGVLDVKKTAHDSMYQTIRKKESKKDTNRSPPARAHARADRGTRLPDDWQPSDGDRSYAMSHNVDPTKAAADMRNYWLGLPDTARARKLDWSRTFQNRILTLADQGRFQISRPDTIATFDPSKLTGFAKIAYLDDQRRKAASSQQQSALEVAHG